jgi:hypothetical protein
MMIDLDTTQFICATSTMGISEPSTKPFSYQRGTSTNI